jgi:lipopolysaccharide/colanic/teichoic acid biosynthesis glycosyltransferase
MEHYEPMGNKIEESSLLVYRPSKTYTFFKRLFDILVSLIILILNAPVLMLILVFVFFRFDKPAFVYSEVLGLRGKKFRIYRVYGKNRGERTFIKCPDKECIGSNAENEEKERDNSIREKILESEYIKKLLLFLNVLRGEMSIVGPTPKSVKEMKACEKWHGIRLSVRPGITGLWQIYGISDDGINEMIWYDLKYIRECSLMYDLKLVIKTVRKKLSYRR